MKSKLLISLVLVVVSIVLLTTPALAAKAAARGKLDPGDAYIQGAGRYVFYTSTDDQGNQTVTLTIKAMKLDPDTSYYVGWVINPEPGQIQPEGILSPQQSDSRGKIIWTYKYELFTYTSTDIVYAVISSNLFSNDSSNWVLASPPLTLFPE